MATRAAPRIDLSRFPISDGDAMPETESHRRQLADLLFSLDLLLTDHPRVHVGGNHFVYYNPNNPRDNVSPDVYVVLDVERKPREAYYAFLEGKFPDFVVEIISPLNDRGELLSKRDIYERAGVQEYLVIDQRPGRQAPLRWYRRVEGKLIAADGPPETGLRSGVLGTTLRLVDGWVRVVDPLTGALIPTPAEQTIARREAEAARREAEEALATALAELERLRNAHPEDDANQ